MTAPWERLGLYVHVPYCLQRCAYCDFFTMPLEGERDSQFRKYLDALQQELAKQVEVGDWQPSLSSIFFGGGTPSLLAPDELGEILEAVGRYFSFDGVEVTLEVNPETIDRVKVEAFKERGINRVSMGVQALSADALKMLGRSHSGETAKKAYETVREAGIENVSMDMIHGRPQLTTSVWAQELETLLSWGPDHLSLYELILEPGTPMTRAVKRGDLVLPDEEERWEMYRLCREITAAHGLSWYEVSNFSKPGRESQHNLDNWRGAAYLGIGPGAHSFRAGPGWGARRANPRNMPMYLGRPEAAPWKERTREETIQEALMNGLRLREGLSLDALCHYGIELATEVTAPLKPLIDADYLVVEEEHWKLTPRGMELLDAVVAHLDPT